MLCLLAQHYNRRRLTEKALAHIDEAIEHTPTIIDLYSVKALIYKRAGSTGARPRRAILLCIPNTRSAETHARVYAMRIRGCG